MKMVSRWCVSLIIFGFLFYGVLPVTAADLDQYSRTELFQAADENTKTLYAYMHDPLYKNRYEIHANSLVINPKMTHWRAFGYDSIEKADIALRGTLYTSAHASLQDIFNLQSLFVIGYRNDKSAYWKKPITPFSFIIRNRLKTDAVVFFQDGHKDYRCMILNSDIEEPSLPFFKKLNKQIDIDSVTYGPTEHGRIKLQFLSKHSVHESSDRYTITCPKYKKPFFFITHFLVQLNTKFSISYDACVCLPYLISQLRCEEIKHTYSDAHHTQIDITHCYKPKNSFWAENNTADATVRLARINMDNKQGKSINNYIQSNKSFSYIAKLLVVAIAGNLNNSPLFSMLCSTYDQKKDMRKPLDIKGIRGMISKGDSFNAIVGRLIANKIN